MNIYARMTSRKILVMMIYACITQQLCDRYDELRDFRMDIVKSALTHLPESYRFPLFSDTAATTALAEYMIVWFFNTEKNHQIDMHFITTVAKLRDEHIVTLIALINTHTTTFTLMQMDPMDQALLLAWGMEYIAHQTPREVLINEMIEIAKRYGDETSPKLINGIGHKMIEQLAK